MAETKASQNSFYTPQHAQTSDVEAFSFQFNQMLSGNFFIEIVMVTAVSGTAPNLTVDVMPLVLPTDITGAALENSPVYNCPVFRLQRGNSGVIMNPVVGDIGMLAVCDKDTTLVRANRKQEIPGSARKHSKSDGIYLGGLINANPTQYVEFADSAINIVSPNQVNVTAPTAVVTASQGVTVDTPTAHFTGNVTADGDITDNSGTQSASLKALRDAYDSHTHDVAGVESGSSTVTSKITGSQV